METKKIQVVTLIIREKALLMEKDNVILFKSLRKNAFMLPKKCIYNFEKVITWFPHWKGRYQDKAFKFQIPLWLYEEKKDEIPALLDNIIVENTHV